MLPLPPAWHRLNALALPDERANACAIALCALVTVAALDEALIGSLVRARGGLPVRSVIGFLVVKTVNSPGALWAVLRGRALGLDGTYRRERMAPVPGAVRIPVLGRALAVKATVVLAEVLVICLAFPTTREVPLQCGRFVVAVGPVGGGPRVDRVLGPDKPLACYDILTDRGVVGPPDSISRVTQAVHCTSRRSPVPVAGADEIHARGRPPPGFLTFTIEVDHSGDKVVIMQIDGKVVGAERYGYFSSEQRIVEVDGEKVSLVEGSIPTADYKDRLSRLRKPNMTAEEMGEWRKGVHRQLRRILRGAYRSAYEGARGWDEWDGEHIGMVAYFNMDVFPARFSGRKSVRGEQMGRLLAELVAVKSTPKDSPDFTTAITYSDGSKILTTAEDVVEIITVAPVFGLIPWVALSLLMFAVQAALEQLRPNNFYELLLVMFKATVGEGPGSLRQLVLKKLIFHEWGFWMCHIEPGEPGRPAELADRSKSIKK